MSSSPLQGTVRNSEGFQGREGNGRMKGEVGRGSSEIRVEKTGGGQDKRSN